MGTISRIKEYIDFKGVTNKKFEESVGFSNGAFASQLKKNRTIGVDKLENILFTYPDINTEWLLTGKGEMLKTKEAAPYAHSDDLPHAVSEPARKYGTKDIAGAVPAEKSTVGIPLIPISAFAGTFTTDTQILEYDCERFVVPTFKGADFLIPVKGSSMYPKYSSGDIVACKRLSIDTFFQWNKVYVLDTDQGPLIKRVQKGSVDNTILIVSDNKAYDPFELDRTNIYNIALVLGVIRLE